MNEKVITSDPVNRSCDLVPIITAASGSGSGSVEDGRRGVEVIERLSWKGLASIVHPHWP